MRDNANWREGCISQYESRWSIVQKYCILNRISFKTFFEELGIVTPSSVPKLVQLERLPQQVLGERIPEFRKSHFLNELSLFLPQIWADRCARGWLLLPEFLKVRYCPACLKIGFHSLFHQVPFFDRCLLHGEPLRNCCPVCERSVSASKWFRCRCGYEYWPGGFARIWKPIEDGQFEPVKDYLAWLQSLEMVNLCFPFGSPLEYAGQGGGWDREMGAFMWFLSSISPMPTRVECAMMPSRLTLLKKTIKIQGVNETRVLSAIQKHTRLESALSLSWCVDVISDVPTTMKSVARYVIRELLDGHHHCKSQANQVLVDSFGTHDWRGKAKQLGPICPKVAAASSVAEVVLRPHWKLPPARHYAPDCLDSDHDEDIAIISNERDSTGNDKIVLAHPALEEISKFYWSSATLGFALEELDYWKGYWGDQIGRIKRRDVDRCCISRLKTTGPYR